MFSDPYIATSGGLISLNSTIMFKQSDMPSFPPQFTQPPPEIDPTYTPKNKLWLQQSDAHNTHDTCSPMLFMQCCERLLLHRDILRVDVERGDVVREINTSCPVAVAGGRHRNGNLMAFSRVRCICY
jgi:hypothetical protein